MPEDIRAHVERLREQGAITLRGDRVYNTPELAMFYEERGFSPAWTRRGAVEELIAAIRSVERDGLTPDHYHLRAIEDAVRAGDSVTTDLLATDALVHVLSHLRRGKVDPTTFSREWNHEPRADSTTLTELLNLSFMAPSVGHVIDQQRPAHFIYEGLVRTLAEYRLIAQRGGWPSIPPGPRLSVGDSDRRVPALRERLAATGDLAAGADRASEAFDAVVEAGIKTFQDRHRLTPDGVLGKATLDALNVTVGARVEQIRVNLERARWVLGGLGDSFVLVNLPAFKAYVIKDRSIAWEARTQIGKTARQTPTFRADMRYLVVNPTWTVPPTILRNDIVPAARKDPGYLQRRGLVAINSAGAVVDPASIDWSRAATRFPYTLEQPAGRDNALGRVKFIFPNPYAIFLHDTPSRALFTPDERTFSSGCIRVESALDLAAVLLEGTDWTREKVEQAAESGKTQTILLERPLPVVIVYWTVSVGEKGVVRFARDVYSYDSRVARALDAPVHGAVTWR